MNTTQGLKSMRRFTSRGYRHVTWTELDFNYAYANQQRIMLSLFCAYHEALLDAQAETLSIRPDLNR